MADLNLNFDYESSLSAMSKAFDKEFSKSLEKSIMRGVVGGMDMAFDTKNLEKLDMRQNYIDFWEDASYDAGKVSAEAFEEGIEAVIPKKGFERTLVDQFLGAKTKVKEIWGAFEEGHPILAKTMKYVGGATAAFAGFSVIKDIFFDLADAQGELRKATIKAFPADEFKQKATEFASAALEIRASLPNTDLKELGQTMSKFAQEGLVGPTKDVQSLTHSMAAFAEFNGDVSSSLIPVISSMKKSGNTTEDFTANIDKMLGVANIGFGEFSTNVLSSILDFAKLTGKSDKEALEFTKSSAAMAKGLVKIGMSSEGAAEFMQQLFSDDILGAPAILQRGMAELQKTGDFSTLTKDLESMGPMLAQSLGDPMAMQQMAKSLGLSQEMVQTLGKASLEGKDLGKVFADMQKEQDKQDISMKNQATAAAAFTDQIAMLKNKALMPVVQFVNENVVPAFEKMIGYFNSDEGTKKLKELGNFFKGLGSILYKVGTGFKVLFVDILGPEGVAILAVAGLLMKLKQLRSAGKDTGKSLGSSLGKSLGKGIQGIMTGFSNGLKAMSLGLKSLANPAVLFGLGAVTLAITALITTIGFFGDKLAPFVESIGTAIATVVKGIAESIGMIMLAAVEAIHAFEQTQIGGAIAGVASQGIGAIEDAISGFRGLFGGGDEVKVSSSTTAINSTAAVAMPKLSNANVSTDEEMLLDDIRKLMVTLVTVNKEQLGVEHGQLTQAQMKNLLDTADRQRG